MTQITEDYVSYEIAVLLKEKGFDGECDYWYGEYGEICCSPSVISVECWCPSQSLALKWLREVHNIDISVYPTIQTDMIVKESYAYTIYKNRQSMHSSCSKTYEEAVEAAINFVLKNLI